MRKLVLFAALLLGTASATKLYTVTVKTAPVYQANFVQVFVAGPNGKGGKVVASKTGTAVTFKLPAGKYTVLTMQSPEYLQQYEVNSVNITVKQNLNVSIPVTAYVHTDAAGRAVFNQLVIDMTGTVMDCVDATVANLCASIELPPHNVQLHIGLADGLVQTKAWTNPDQEYTGEFRVGAARYILTILPLDQGNSSFLTFTRQ